MTVKYKYKIKPFKHQEDALAKGWDKLEFAFFMEMGTGKSKVLLDNLGMLFLAGHIKFALILAPKGVYRNWVTKEIPEHMSDDVPHRMIRWVSGPNKKTTGRNAVGQRSIQWTDNLCYECRIVFNTKGQRLLESGWQMHMDLWDVSQSTNQLLLRTIRPSAQKHC